MKTIFLVTCMVMSSMVTFSQLNVENIISRLNKEMEKDFNKNDMLAVSAYYLDSAVILGGGMNITGRKSIDNYWLSLKDKTATWKLEIDKIEDHETIVIQRGRSYLKMGEGNQSNVRFILIWKRSGDTYKVLYDFLTRL